MIMSDSAEEQKKQEYYDSQVNPCLYCGSNNCEDCIYLEEEEVCDYTGEECFGNKMFCEECSVLMEENNC